MRKSKKKLKEEKEIEDIKEEKKVEENRCPMCGKPFSEDNPKCLHCGRCSECCECGEV